MPISTAVKSARRLTRQMNTLQSQFAAMRANNPTASNADKWIKAIVDNAATGGPIQGAFLNLITLFREAQAKGDSFAMQRLESEFFSASIQSRTGASDSLSGVNLRQLVDALRRMEEAEAAKKSGRVTDGDRTQASAVVDEIERRAEASAGSIALPGLGALGGLARAGANQITAARATERDRLLGNLSGAELSLQTALDLGLSGSAIANLQATIAAVKTQIDLLNKSIEKKTDDQTKQMTHVINVARQSIEHTVAKTAQPGGMRIAHLAGKI